MRDAWDEVAELSRAPRRRRHRKREKSAAEREQKQAYRAARRRAALKLSFVTHLVAYASVCLLLLGVAGFRVMFIVGLSWGVGVAIHYFAALVAPDLRQRFIEQEVERQVETSTSQARRSLRDKHSQSLEELSASIAHEFRNRITAAKSLVHHFFYDTASTENVDYAKVALEELDRVERSISHLLRFARDEEIRVAPVSLLEIVDSAVETFRDRLQRVGVELARDVETDGAVRGDAEKLRRVLINLLGNALDALEQARSSAPRIELTAGENLAGTEVWLRIRDNGPGIEPESLARIFSPFYTSKENGTGLGLALSKKVVDAHSGSLEVQSEPGLGAEFLLTLPKRTASEGAEN